MPGIHLYSSNRLEILAETFARLQRSKPLPPLQTETVLVQSRGMARWLAMETARSIKIWANVIYPFLILLSGKSINYCCRIFLTSLAMKRRISSGS